jgi:hypothetical protein
MEKAVANTRPLITSAQQLIPIPTPAGDPLSSGASLAAPGFRPLESSALCVNLRLPVNSDAEAVDGTQIASLAQACGLRDLKQFVNRLVRRGTYFDAGRGKPARRNDPPVRAQLPPPQFPGGRMMAKNRKTGRRAL